MYAVIKTGGKQHKVAEGEILKVEKLKASEGEPVDITLQIRHLEKLDQPLHLLCLQQLNDLSNYLL